jgi:hypothetical protein
MEIMELAISIPSIRKLHHIDDWANAFPLQKARIKSLLELMKNRHNHIVVNVLESMNIKFSHVYFGNEFCQKIIPNSDEVKKAFNYARYKGLTFSLVTPYVTNEGLKKIEPLLQELSRKSASCEVIVNDYGVLELLRQEFANLKPVLGRILDKQDREPRYPLGEKHKLEKKASQFSVPAYNDFMKSNGVRRIEFDYGQAFKTIDLRQSGFKVSVYVPYGYITTGRICMIGSLHQPVGKKFLVNGKCAKECQSFSSLLYNPQLAKEKKLINRGNTVFFTNDLSMLNDLQRICEIQGVDRIVFQPDIPM